MLYGVAKGIPLVPIKMQQSTCPTYDVTIAVLSITSLVSSEMIGALAGRASEFQHRPRYVGRYRQCYPCKLLFLYHRGITPPIPSSQFLSTSLSPPFWLLLTSPPLLPPLTSPFIPTSLSWPPPPPDYFPTNLSLTHTTPLPYCPSLSLFPPLPFPPSLSSSPFHT